MTPLIRCSLAIGSVVFAMLLDSWAAAMLGVVEGLAACMGRSEPE